MGGNGVNGDQSHHHQYPVEYSKLHRASESHGNHRNHGNEHNHHFEENDTLRHRTAAKPVEVMTVINTEARTVLSDVTSSSSGESTDHADDDQFDSVSTRMRSDRKFGRRKHKKHCKMEQRKKEKRLQGVPEEEVE